VNRNNTIIAALVLTVTVVIAAYALITILDDDDTEDNGPYYTISFQVVSGDDVLFPFVDGNLTDPGTRIMKIVEYDAVNGAFLFFSNLAGGFIQWEVSIEFHNLVPLKEYNIKIGFKFDNFIPPLFQAPSLHDTLITSCEDGKISLIFHMTGGNNLGSPFIIGFGAPK